MKNQPRKQGASIITKPMRNFILGVGACFLVLFIITMVFRNYFSLDASTTLGRHNLTIFFSAFVFMQFWNLWNARVFGSTRSAFSHLRGSRGFLLMAGIIVLGQLLLVEFGGEMFRVTPLSLKEWVAIIVLTSPVLWVGEIWRAVMRSSKSPDYWRYS
ncbi:MAG: cation transporting ATPase C-terminal domain-containing protein [Planctomycetaceae bacterium]|nr:cation transporting ATPase C-terminal domain-containing protein [Planctomycetaceae bacterium]